MDRFSIIRSASFATGVRSLLMDTGENTIIRLDTARRYCSRGIGDRSRGPPVGLLLFNYLVNILQYS
jgi:hypothetical protein